MNELGFLLDYGVLGAVLVGLVVLYFKHVVPRQDKKEAATLKTFTDGFTSITQRLDEHHQETIQIREEQNRTMQSQLAGLQNSFNEVADELGNLGEHLTRLEQQVVLNKSEIDWLKRIASEGKLGKQ